MSDYVTQKDFFEAMNKMSDENKKDRHDSNNRVQELILKLEDKLDKYFEISTPMQLTLAKHTEKHKIIDESIIEMRWDIKIISTKIDGINLKIAWVTWAWAVILFFIQYAFNKLI